MTSRVKKRNQPSKRKRARLTTTNFPEGEVSLALPRTEGRRRPTDVKLQALACKFLAL